MNKPLETSASAGATGQRRPWLLAAAIVVNAAWLCCLAWMAFFT